MNNSNLFALLTSVVGGSVGAILAFGANHYFWTLSRRAARRDALAEVAGNYIATAFHCLEMMFDATIYGIISDNYANNKAIGKEEVEAKQKEYIESRKEALHAQIQLEAALAKLRIATPSKNIQNHAQTLTRCLRNFPYEPEGIEGWSESQFDMHREYLGGPYKLTDLDLHPYTSYRLRGFKLIINDFSIALSDQIEHTDPITSQPL